jgi:hypothetical protein
MSLGAVPTRTDSTTFPEHRRGHAEPVIGPAKGRTRWLCPPYGLRCYNRENPEKRSRGMAQASTHQESTDVVKVEKYNGVVMNRPNKRK